MRNRLVGLTILLSLAIGCAGRNVQNSQAYKLPSGKEIRVNSISKMSFPKGGPALVMNYETDIPIENKEALRKEVNEIWSVFQKDVEKAQVEGAAIRATHYEGSGLVRQGKGYGFVYTKGPDGQWRLLEDDKK
jgi:hypothetical protein